MMKMKLYVLFIFTILLGAFPVGVFAHGTEDEHQKEVFLQNVITYSLYGTSILVILFVILLILTKKKINQVNVKKKEGREKRDTLNQIAKFYKWLSILSLIALILAGGLNLMTNKTTEKVIEFQHIHGLGFTDDGEGIYVPAHDGLRVYSDGQWTIPDGEKHDYMGFSMVDDGFYSSGHPSPGSNMKNPFGIVKSEDMGESLETLDLYGEIDFHNMAVGYYSHAIYVQNPQPNSKMDDTGLYYSLDNTKTWKKSEMNGIEGEPVAMAVHPSKENVIVISTDKGVFLSTDHGNQFDGLVDRPATSLAFTKEGNLLAGILTNQPSLIKVNIDSRQQTTIQIPKVKEEDAISFIAANPQNPDELVLTTFLKDIYLTNNNGEQWEKIAEVGTASKLSDEAAASHKDDHDNQMSTHSNGDEEKDELPLDVSWNFDQDPQANSKQTLEININDKSGQAMEDFDVEHEKLMHLIVVSKDLSVFQHLHPEFNGNGQFTIPTKFPKGGQYKLIADVVPSGYSTSTVTEWIDVSGNAKSEKLVVDSSLTKVVKDKKVSLEFDQLTSNKDVNMTFTIQDNETGEPITDLQPYLGAIGHVVIVSKDGEDYLHSHPMNSADERDPKAEFMTLFPESGVYKIWGQFQHNDQIITAPFVVEVP